VPIVINNVLGQIRSIAASGEAFAAGTSSTGA
jgi:hypothetical protein